MAFSWGRRTLPYGSYFYYVMLTVLVLLMGGLSAAFVTPPAKLGGWLKLEKVESPSPSPSSLSLSAGDIFDEFKKFWNQGDGNGNGGGGDEEKDVKSQNKPWPYIWNSDRNEGAVADDEGDEDDDEMAAGTTLLLSIRAEQLKPGGLRLFLMFYLLGMQNTPDRNSWRANQPTTDEYVLEMLFQKDASAMIQVELSEDEIRILRCGSLPSTAYLMQEAVILDGILDELHQCAFGDDSIPAEHRLLIPEPRNAIEMARESLAFG